MKTNHLIIAAVAVAAFVMYKKSMAAPTAQTPLGSKNLTVDLWARIWGAHPVPAPTKSSDGKPVSNGLDSVSAWAAAGIAGDGNLRVPGIQ